MRPNEPKRPDELSSMNLFNSYSNKVADILNSLTKNDKIHAVKAIPFVLASYIEWLKAFSCQQRIDELPHYFTEDDCFDFTVDLWDIFSEDELRPITNELFDMLQQYRQLLFTKLRKLSSDEQFQLRINSNLDYEYENHFIHIEDIKKINTKEIISNLESLRQLYNLYNEKFTLKLLK